MAEKGGKGFTLPKGGKTSLKSPASQNGKDDSSAKSKRGRKVQFDSEDSQEPMTNSSSKSAGKFDNPFSKGDWGKGGKGDKFANGGKSPAPKEPPALELKIEQELPKNAKCLMDCEAANILQGIQEQMVVLSEDPTIKLPVAFDRGLQYAKTRAVYTSPQSVRRTLDALKVHGVSDGEICVIANTCPESVGEVFALVPSFKGKKTKLREPLKAALSDLAMLKRSGDMKP